MNRLNMTRHALAQRIAIYEEIYFYYSMVLHTEPDGFVEAYNNTMEQYAAVCAIRNAIRKGYKA